MPTINISFTAGPLQLQASRGLFSAESVGSTLTVAGSGGGTLTVVTASLPNALVGQSYSATLSATGGTAPYSWNIVTATPNTDLWLRCANSAVYGIPQLTETEAVTLQVTDSTGATAQANLNLVVGVTGALAVATPQNQSASSYYQGYGSVAGAVFSLRMLAQGGQPPYIWSFSGPTSIATGSTTTSNYSLPFSGWLQSPSIGNGLDTLTALCTDSAGASFTQSVQVNVHPTALYFYPLDFTHTVPTLNLPPAYANTPYKTQLRVAGGSGLSQVYSITSGSLPSGLFLSNTGFISGTPSASGNINNCQIQCTDSANNVATAYLYLNVSSQNKTARPAYNTGAGFYVDAGGVFRDSLGYVYQFRGINKLHYDSSSWAGNTNGALANPGIVRAWVFDSNAGGTGAAAAAYAANQVTTQYQPNNILTLLTLAGISSLSPTGTTGQTNTAYITQATADFVSYYSTLVPVMNSIAINLANEWGPTNSTSWRDTYITAVQALRTAGYTCPIFIDTGGGGQDPFDILNYAAAVLAADTQKNLVFCYHSYANTNPYQCNINSVTTGATTTVTLNSSLPYHPFNPTNPANGSYSGLNQFIVTGAQGMTQLNGTFASQTNTYGSQGAWQLHLNVNSTAWGGVYTPNSATVTAYCTSAAGAGGWDYRKLYADFAALRSSGVCVALMEFGPGNQLGDPALKDDPRNQCSFSSHPNTSIGQLVSSAEASGLPWCYWAWDDHGGGCGTPPTPVNGFWGFFGAVQGNNGVYTNTASFTAAGLESVANPRYGTLALSQPAASFLIVDPLTLPLVDSSTPMFTFVGTFTVPRPTFNFGGVGLGINPLPNGQGGTLYLSSVNAGAGATATLGAVTLPTLAQIQGGGAAATTLYAPVKQTFDMGASLSSSYTVTQGSLYYNGNVYSTQNVFYDAGGHQSAVIFNCAPNLTGAGTPCSMQGYFGATVGPRFYAGALGLVPTAWRSLIGGPAFVTMGPGQGIIANSVCNGLGFSTFNPANVTTSGGTVTATDFAAWKNATLYNWGNATQSGRPNITGSITSHVLTITSVNVSGLFAGVNSWVTCPSITTAGSIFITSQLTGAAGGVGTYQLSGSPPNVASGAMFVSNTSLTPCTGGIEPPFPVSGGDDFFSEYDGSIGCAFIPSGYRSLLIISQHQYGPVGVAPQGGGCPQACDVGASGTNEPRRIQVTAYDLAALYAARQANQSPSTVTPYAWWSFPNWQTIFGNCPAISANMSKGAGWWCYDPVNRLMYASSWNASAQVTMQVWSTAG